MNRPVPSLHLPGGLVLLLCLLSGSCRQKAFRIEEPAVTFVSNLSRDPVFSWKMQPGSGAFEQGAYQLQISEDTGVPEPGRVKIWDSRKVESSHSVQVRYGGPALQSGRPYQARVRVWDRHGGRSDWSEGVRFVVPLEYPRDWPAEWLTCNYDPEAPLPLFRKEFGIRHTDAIRDARLYIAAPGYYEVSLNGRKVGDHVLDPGQTNYEDYTYYTAYDIDPGELGRNNALGVMLGNGWYNQNQVWTGPGGEPGLVYGQPVFVCQLVVQRTDGFRQVISSDTSWKWTPGPITYSNVYGGEHYDARLEVADWNRPGSVAGDWQPAVLARVHPARLFEQFAEPIRVMDSLKWKNIVDRGRGTHIFDMGQNMSGWLRLRIRGERGQEITVRCTEELDPEGNLDPRTTGVSATGVVQTLKYTCKGEGEETWEPRFTYFGFRYAEVKGLTQPVTEDLLTGRVLFSAVPKTGSFRCSEDNINRLHDLARWTIIGNIHSIPTDCPHREKCGWTGDAHAMMRAMIYNYGSQKFFGKYLFDMRSSGREEREELYFGESFHDRSRVLKPAGIPTMIAPGKRTSGVASPDWGTALVQIPWYLYLYYGDRSLLEEFYPDMKNWVQYIHAIGEDGIIPHGLGDWCPPGGNVNIDCPVPVSSTAFHILDVSIMERTAGILGKKADQRYYSGLLEQLKASFNRHFLDVENLTYGSQTADALALDIGIVPAAYRRAVAASIVRNIHEEFDGFLSTGIFGLARVFRVLAENGQEWGAYRLLTKTGRNSFAFMWEEYDATTLWEVLPCNDTYDASIYLRSHSHPMQAGYDEWFYAGLAGINPVPGQPGFQRIKFQPCLTRQLDSVAASYQSGYGTITSSWERKKGRFSWRIRIPANSRGSIHVPTYGSHQPIRLNGKEVEVIRESDGFSLIGEWGPGEYLVEL